MTRFLVEAYTPPSADLAGIETAVLLAVAELSAAGTPVRYAGAIFVAGDELCFHLLDGPAPEAVHAAIVRAGVVPQRIVEVTTGRVGAG